jgi:hypothetical protein
MITNGPAFFHHLLHQVYQLELISCESKGVFDELE